ncbi:MAG TPA: SCO family protein [Bacillales bacterium]|nr:SCO family protein [Bacillales bacterium]
MLLVLGLSACAISDDQNRESEGSGKKNSTQTHGSKAQHATALGEANWIVEPFRYTDQNGKSFGMYDLKGDVWLADMIFTKCTTVCPVLTAHMANLQDKLASRGMNVSIVSFSIDPKRDTPKHLKAYGKKFNVDFSTWHFLTGYSPKEIKQFARTSFKSPITQYKDSDQFAHSTSFFLVNGSGKVMAKYDGLEPPYDKIVKDVKVLRESGGTRVATGDGHSMKTNAALEVNIKVAPEDIRSGESVKIQAVVSQGDEKVKDVKEVMFEVWKEGSSKHQMVTGKTRGNGIYAIHKKFKSPGTYYVMCHVTARGQHIMPKKKFIVQK